MMHQWPPAEFKAPPSISAVLQSIHDEINAIGGVRSRDDHERGINETVIQALGIIEAKQREIS